MSKGFLGFDIIFSFAFFLQIGLFPKTTFLSWHIVYGGRGELAREGSVVVAMAFGVGYRGRWQVTCNRWQVKGDIFSLTILFSAHVKWFSVSWLWDVFLFFFLNLLFCHCNGIQIKFGGFYEASPALSLKRRCISQRYLNFPTKKVPSRWVLWKYQVAKLRW